jgi:superfamily I DNA/RNA helicase
LYVVNATLSERQLRRFCALLNIDAGDERSPQLIAEGQRDTVQAAGLLLELRELVWNGAAVLDVVDKACEALVSVDSSLDKGLERVRDAVEAFQTQDAEFGIDQFLAELALGGIHGSPTTSGGVKLASLHRTKGLQWRHVYLVGMEEGTLPDFHADTPLSIAEERRTCFVGVCRAEEYLTMTRVHALNGWAKSPSSFLHEMGFGTT